MKWCNIAVGSLSSDSVLLDIRLQSEEPAIPSGIIVHVGMQLFVSGKHLLSLQWIVVAYRVYFHQTLGVGWSLAILVDDERTCQDDHCT